MINLALGLIDILCDLRILFFLQYTSAESNNLSTERMDGEHDTASEAICYAPIVVSYHQTGLLQIFSLLTFAHSFFIQRITLVQAISQLELADDVFPEPTLGKVTQADSPSLNVVLE